MRRYMVVADGAGEYDVDFTVTWFDATSPEEAAAKAVHPSQGYGKRDGGKLYVIRAECVVAFATEQRTVTDLISGAALSGGETDE